MSAPTMTEDGILFPAKDEHDRRAWHLTRRLAERIEADPENYTGGDAADVIAAVSLLAGALRKAASAAGMVWKHQHSGSHEQDRWDAQAWLELNPGHGSTVRSRPGQGYTRCECAKCRKVWGQENLATSGTTMGLALAARGKVVES